MVVVTKENSKELVVQTHRVISETLKILRSSLLRKCIILTAFFPSSSKTNGCGCAVFAGKPAADVLLVTKRKPECLVQSFIYFWR